MQLGSRAPDALCWPSPLCPAAPPLLQASAEHMRKQQELMREIELRRRMKATVVPTNDQEVRRMLRQLREPVTLFGEREVSRARQQRGRAHARCCFGCLLGFAWQVCRHP